MRSDHSSVSEQTPLLREQTQPPGTNAHEHDDSAVDPGQEPSFKELILILGCIWLGVFLAALGTCTVAWLSDQVVS